MSYNDNHTDFFSKVEVPYQNTKDECWDMLSDKIDSLPVKSETKLVTMTWGKWVAAALIIVLVGSTFFFRFYQSSISCPKGEQLSHVLPDGSIIELNAASELKYNPYWWKFKREVKFEGEAFFKIQKGERFSIISANGTTEILGTSFNIFSRNNDYKVFCKTGLVKVSSVKTDVELIINPGEMAVINNRLKTSEVKAEEADKVLAWQKAKFNFTEVKLIEVVEEIERQYNVNIALRVNDPDKFVYTGYFAKGVSVESSLTLICKSFNLNFNKDNKGRYIIKDE